MFEALNKCAWLIMLAIAIGLLMAGIEENIIGIHEIVIGGLLLMGVPVAMAITFTIIVGAILVWSVMKDKKNLTVKEE